MSGRDRSRSPRTAANLEHIKSLVQQREQARGAKDFSKADDLRNQLSSMGVELWDKDKIWKQEATGLSGVIIGYFGDRAPSDLEISALCIQREKARLKKDFELSDSIRDELKARGVDLFDKNREWKCDDGRRGRIPTFNEIEQGIKPAGRGDVHAGGAHDYYTNGNQGGGGRGYSKPAISAQLSQALFHAAGIAQREGNQALANQILALSAGGNGGGMPPMPPPRPSHTNGQSQDPEVKRALDMLKRYAQSQQRASYDEIMFFVQTRENVRQARDFNTSDVLRDGMKKIGIELYEKEKRWSTSYGDQGAIPMWN